ncbi:MAG: molybdopterin-dependent oxidoreductase [Bacteroidales bacterium]|nr:molybdopterin-dependent oxidoreductase [Bacteroidales bacterium]MCF8343228.1 molybdopterin-dependent oxidoreductase [Bacteroidales bacterium]MCF8350869.1 molybdopterin-dependent oxidoreductase [Bacteroidales bacterium]MCF8374863.1 molybdopterin-dependent oxidoreductase [Bacteroidales bacterium]MCF8399733.1 molybdopterin-dependent oxidoreductase [Bacteroidales bacterium]
MSNRREFIKISSLGAGGLALAANTFSWSRGMSFAQDIFDDKAEEPIRTPTYCELCFWKCAGWVYKDDIGDIRKITGNDDDPHCNGRFCPRGTGGVGMYYDKDRLRRPLIRTGEKGEQTFREASWDEAFDYIAKKMNKIAEEHGPECIALFTHGSGGKFFSTLLKAFGSTNIAAPSFAQCRGPREVGFLATFGELVLSPERTDIRDTKCLVLIGSHLGENMHNGQVQEMSDAIDKGATIITVDPRYSIAAGKSKYWLPIKPSTDLALLLTWINLIIQNEWYDKDYVEKYTYGFDVLKETVKPYTPEWAYGITGLKPDMIYDTAKAMHDAAPAVIIHPGRHVTWYGDDTQRSRAIAILNAILGSWGRRGGFYYPEVASLPDYPHPPFPEPKRTWRDAFPGKFNLANEVLSTGICEATIPNTARDCSFKGWFVYGTNLIKTLPNRKQTLEAIQSLDLLVAIDTMPMEITGYADVILPECTYLERYDLLRTSPHREPNIALRMPAAKPKYDTKPAWWMAKKLASKLGLDEYFAWNDIEKLLDWQLKQIGSSLDEMKRIGVKKFPRKYDDLYFWPNQDFVFNTNSGKIELYSTDMENEGFDPIPKYTPHPEPPEGYYRLIYGRAPMHTFSRTINNPNLVDLMAENSVWINPKVTKIWGLKNGQEIYLQNQDGVVSEFPIKVRATERIRWDSVYIVHGFGHSNKKLTRAFGKGASDSELITNVMMDPVMGGTGMRGNFVTFLTEKPIGEEVKS